MYNHGTVSLSTYEISESQSEFTLRYQMSKELAEERLADGLSVDANILVGSVTVNRNTGIATYDDVFGFVSESWNIYDGMN